MIPFFRFSLLLFQSLEANYSTLGLLVECRQCREQGFFHYLVPYYAYLRVIPDPNGKCRSGQFKGRHCSIQPKQQIKCAEKKMGRSDLLESNNWNQMLKCKLFENNEGNGKQSICSKGKEEKERKREREITT
jgi:hypothetical protein